MAVSFTGDALFFNTPNGGDLEFVDGEPTRTGGLPGAVYILLFGGNNRDEGEAGSEFSWWGNRLEEDPSLHIRGEVGSLMQHLPLTGPNLLRIQDAAERDLSGLVTLGIITELTATAVIEGPKRLRLTLDMNYLGQPENQVYRLNWGAQQ